MDADKTPVILPWDDHSGNENSAHAGFEKQNTKTLNDEDPSIDEVLDSACHGLRNKHTQYSIRRIQKMEEELDMLEKELDHFLSSSQT